MLLTLVLIAVGFFIVERLWPANELPRVRAWWPRVILINLIQFGVVLLAGLTWDRWLQDFSLLAFRDWMHPVVQGGVAYFVSTFVYYWWHRYRHESKLFWLLCHQIHHSPQRIELLTSFYKHPVEIVLNSILSAGILYTLLGCSPLASASYTFLIAVAEYFYHWNIKTPYWVGHWFQRPESHRIHHKFKHHTQNYADLPLWDKLFGTFHNPKEKVERCGYHDWREDRFEDMLAFRDVHAKGSKALAPLHFLPTCIGCSKRWACYEANQTAQSETNHDEGDANRTNV